MIRAVLLGMAAIALLACRGRTRVRDDAAARRALDAAADAAAIIGRWTARAPAPAATARRVETPTPPWPAGFGPVCSAYSDVAATMGLACAVCTSGQVYCWGDPGTRLLAASGSAPVITEITALAGAVSISTRGGYACARFPSGAVHCSAHDRAVANGAIALPARATSVGAGSHHACAVLDTKQVACWGENDHGQLGADEPGVGASVQLVVRTVPGLAAERLSVGANVSCAIDTEHRAWCWGWNGSGMLALGHDKPVRGPQRIGTFDDAIEIATDGAVGCLQRKNGSVVCWGELEGLVTPVKRFAARGVFPRGALVVQGDAVSVLGEDGTITRAAGRDAPAPMSEPTAARVLAGTADVSCAVLRSGEVRCWGRNDRGFLILSAP